MKFKTSLFSLIFIFAMTHAFDMNAYQVTFSAPVPYAVAQPNTNKAKRAPAKKTSPTPKASPKGKKQIQAPKKAPQQKKTPQQQKAVRKAPNKPAQMVNKAPRKPAAKPIIRPAPQPQVKQAPQQAKKNNYQNNPAPVRVNEKNYESYWDKGTFPTAKQSIDYHTKKHANGKSALQYTNEATKFYNENKNLRKNTALGNGSEGYRINKGKEGGIWTKDGKIVTYWVNP